MFTNITAIFQKQCKDSLKNKMFILTFFMFPLLSIVFKLSMDSDSIKTVLPVFVTMHLILMPILNMASIISEEKEKNTLKELFLANVKPIEYLGAIGSFVLLMSLVSSMIFVPIIKIDGTMLFTFLLIVVCGTLCSIVLGAIIGLRVKNQMSVGSIAAPIAMILGILPVISQFNNSILNVSKAIYSYYIFKAIGNSNMQLDIAQYEIIGVNFLVFALLFAMTFAKHRRISG